MLVNVVVNMQWVVPHSITQPDSQRRVWSTNLSGSGAVGVQSTSNALPVLQKYFKCTSHFVITITQPARITGSRSHSTETHWSDLNRCSYYFDAQFGEVCTQFQEKNKLHFSWCNLYQSQSSMRYVHHSRKSQLCIPDLHLWGIVCN